VLPNLCADESTTRHHQQPTGGLEMTASTTNSHQTSCYELRFRSLFDEGRGYAFPCDALGHVDIDALGNRARLNYLYARTVVGREFATPAVHFSDLH